MYRHVTGLTSNTVHDIYIWAHVLSLGRKGRIQVFQVAKGEKKERKKGEYLKIKELTLPPESEPKRAVVCRERPPKS
jgi:hypothetical protein